MAVRYAQKDEFASVNTLCETCANAVPQSCAFMQDKKSESALAAMGAVAIKIKFSRNKGVFYKVTSCPKYKAGNLPELSLVTGKGRREKLFNMPAGYNLSCPECGSANHVKVARTSMLEPQDWFCRCTKCNKSFRPRKEVNNVATRLDFDLKLDKEKYLMMKAKGYPDAKILDFCGLDYKKYISILTQVKKEWGVGGLNLKATKQNAKLLSNQPVKDIQEPQPETSGSKQQIGSGQGISAFMDDDEPGIPIVPRMSITSPVLRFYQKGLTCNRSAGRMFNGTRYFKVEATRSGRIRLIPSSEPEGCYRFSRRHKKSESARMGAEGLVKQLCKAGVAFGCYHLVWSEARGRWETTGNVAL